MTDAPGGAPWRLDRTDVVLRGEQAGTGPTILLLHAGGERRQVWTPVVEVLVTAGFRSVAVDQRGHGDSDGVAETLESYAGDVTAMLRTEPGRCIVVGASLGGLAAMVALADPAVREKTEGVVLVDVVPNLEPARACRFLREAGVLDRHSDLVDDVLVQIPRLSHGLAAFDRPVLLVRGGPGSAVVDEDVIGLLRLAPHAEVAAIPAAGHLVARDQPAALARIIAERTAAWPALGLLREVSAGQLDHPGGHLLDHLRRVHRLVAAWGGSRRARLAALCHAMYGTDGFPHPLLDLDQRDRVRAVIGDEAESLVYLYGACDRARTYPHLDGSPVALTDRFTGETAILRAGDLAEFALLTVANELDVARTAALDESTRQGIRSLIAGLAIHAPDVCAEALADPCWRRGG
ncbi:MAG TPA: alpha/beta hydrolase [Pseudonocardia sp.]|nr:alpha/beta hydrolase [Pseudonocardia sp.]